MGVTLKEVNHMGVMYTPEQMQATLIALRIKPKNGMVTGSEAARILTWRAEDEQGVKHRYLDSAVRRHVERGNIKAYPVNARFNMYKVEDVFEIPLSPRRGRVPKSEQANAA